MLKFNDFNPFDLIDWERLNKVIVVGMDGVGKTTMCKRLEDKGFVYVKASVGDGTDKIQLSKDMLSTYKNCDKVVFDRFYFPDDLIYSKIIKGTENDRDFDNWSEIIDLIREQNITIVFMTDDISSIVSRFVERGDEYIEVDQLWDIKSHYGDILENIRSVGLKLITMHVGDNSIVVG